MLTAQQISPDSTTPSLKRRFACLVYEALLLAALLFMAGYLVVGLRPQEHAGLFRLYLLAVCGGYFVWFWRHGGQTLPMKTWGIRLVDVAGRPVRLANAWLRYLYAVLGTAAFGLGFVWAIWDRDRQFLHDRLAGTRLVISKAAGRESHPAGMQ